MLSGNSKMSGEEMTTVIGKETKFTGTIDLKGGLRVDGVVKGKIISTDEVTVGSSGLVEAQIEARSAVIAGKMVGDIHATERIELQANCDVEGDLRTKSLVIEQGAVFCGGCHMKEGKSGNLGFIPPEEKKTVPAEESGGGAFEFGSKKDKIKIKA